MFVLLVGMVTGGSGESAEDRTGTGRSFTTTLSQEQEEEREKREERTGSSTGEAAYSSPS